ncbi:MAG TPA: hypothetical protein VF043_14490 [Ktedonobacteraceae bacterium]
MALLPPGTGESQEGRVLCQSDFTEQTRCASRGSRAPELVYKVLESEIANETGGTEGVDSALLNKACCHLGSGTEEEKRGSSGRIRDLRMRPAGEQAERNLTEPTGIGIALTSVNPLRFSSGKAVPKTPQT